MKSLSCLNRQILVAYYRNQQQEVKANIRLALGFPRDSSFDRSQVSDNQLVTIPRRK